MTSYENLILTNKKSLKNCQSLFKISDELSNQEVSKSEIASENYAQSLNNLKNEQNITNKNATRFQRSQSNFPFSNNKNDKKENFSDCLNEISKQSCHHSVLKNMSELWKTYPQPVNEEEVKILFYFKNLVIS